MSSRAVGTVARAAIVLVAFNILSKITALVREMVTAQQFGAKAGMDAYLVAFTMPSVLFYLFTGALATVVVPIYSEYASRGQDREAWDLFGTLFSVLLLLLIATTAAGLVFAPLLVKLLAPGLEKTTVDLAVELTRLMFPLLIFSGLAALFSGLLNARNIFAITALNGPLSNIAVIVAILLLGSTMGLYGLALGVLVGGAAGALVQLPALRRAGFRFSPGAPLRHPDLKKILKLVLPITVGLSISQTYILVNRFLASGLPEGSISALNYADKLIQMPVGLFVTAIGTAVFPFLTRRAVEKDWTGLAIGVRKALRLVFLVCVPAAVALLVLRDPLVTLFFKRGAFDARAVDMTTVALFFYSFGLMGQAGEFILARGFFSLQDTRTPVIFSAIAMAINLVLSLALLGPMRHGGLALANSIAALANMTMLTAGLNRRIGGLWIPEMWRFVALVFIASGLMGGAIGAVTRWSILTSPAAQVGLSAVAGTVIYLAALFVFRVDEARRLRELIKQTVSRLKVKEGKS